MQFISVVVILDRIERTPDAVDVFIKATAGLVAAFVVIRTDILPFILEILASIDFYIFLQHQRVRPLKIYAIPHLRSFRKVSHHRDCRMAEMAIVLYVYEYLHISLEFMAGFQVFSPPLRFKG
jgi:hypothetical protein